MRTQGRDGPRTTLRKGTMLNLHARPALNRMLAPVGAGLVRLGVTPDVITIVGTIGVATGAFVFFPRGHLFGAPVFITSSAFPDPTAALVCLARGPTGPRG